MSSQNTNWGTNTVEVTKNLTVEHILRYTIHVLIYILYNSQQKKIKDPWFKAKSPFAVRRGPNARQTKSLLYTTKATHGKDQARAPTRARG